MQSHTHADLMMNPPVPKHRIPLVYFRQDMSRGGLIRIGKTVCTLKKRMSSAASESAPNAAGQSVIVLGCTNRYREAEINKMFSNFRIRTASGRLSSWFRADPELLAWIAANTTMPSDHKNQAIQGTEHQWPMPSTYPHAGLDIGTLEVWRLIRKMRTR